MKCSIIIPLYNKEKSIGVTIQSVLNQTHKEFELIIVDDGSTDNSARVVNKIKDDRIRYFFQDNGGVSSARNIGVKMAQYDWILFLDADDTLESRCLEILSKPLEENCGIDISASRFFIGGGTSPQTLNTGYCFTGFVPNNYKWMFLNRYSLRTGCCLIRKDLLKKFPFDETLYRFEDMKSILEWIRKANIYISAPPVMTYQTTNSELSSIAKDKHKDFIFNMNFENKGIWEKLILGKLLYLGWIGYRNDHYLLKEQYGKYFLFMILAKLNLLLKHYRI